MAFSATLARLSGGKVHDPPFVLDKSTRLASALLYFIKSKGSSPATEEEIFRQFKGKGVSGRWELRRLLRWMDQERMLVSQPAKPEPSTSKARLYSLRPSDSNANAVR